MKNPCEMAYCTGETAQAGAVGKKGGGGWFNGGCSCGGTNTGAITVGDLSATLNLPMRLAPPPSFSQQNTRTESAPWPPPVP
jgi:hypothetical protein